MNEIVHDTQTGQTLYSVRWLLGGNVLLTDGASNEVWGTGGRDAGDYAVTMSENAPDGHYVGNFDTSSNIADDVYQVAVFIQAGGSPVNSDIAAARGQMHWSGTAEENTATLGDQLDGLTGSSFKHVSEFGPGE